MHISAWEGRDVRPYAWRSESGWRPISQRREKMNIRNDIDDKSSLTADELVTTKFSHRVTYEPANAIGKGERARLVSHSIAPFPNGVEMLRERMSDLRARRQILVAVEPFQEIR